MKNVMNTLSLLFFVTMTITAQVHQATYSISNNSVPNNPSDVISPSDAIKNIKMNLTEFCANEGAGNAEVDRRRGIKMKIDQQIQILEGQAKAQKNSAMLQAVQALRLQVQALGKAAIEQDLDSVVALGNKVSMKLAGVESTVSQ